MTETTAQAGKPRIDEDLFWRISSRIERNMEKYMRKIGEEREECERVLYLMEDNIYDLEEWKWDSDTRTAEIAREALKKETDYLEDMSDIVYDNKLDYDYDLTKHLAKEEQAINENFGCNLKIFTERREGIGLEVNGTLLIIEAEDFEGGLKKDARCSSLDIEKLKETAPLAYAGIMWKRTEDEAAGAIRREIEKSDRVERCKDAPEVELEDYPVYTENADLSYACNPWSTEFFSDELKERIEEAKERVIYEF